LHMLRAAITFLLTLSEPGPAIEASRFGDSEPIRHRLNSLGEVDELLKMTRSNLPECEPGCITPDEAAVMAFSAGEDAAQPGRFLLDVRGGGQSIHGDLGQLFFVNSRQDYATLGTLTIAFEPDALRALLQRAKVCGAASVVDGQINVKGCRSSGVSDLNMFTMMQRLGGRRIVVDGEVRLRWIDSSLGLPRPVANKRGEHELGYYQVWVRVDDADKVIFVYDD
jgi:hypothetical protein